jgi:hypothetical protein
MARFYGEVGYADSVETPSGSGVWIDDITEAVYQGDIIRNVFNHEDNQKLNEDIVVSNSISVIADQYAIDHVSKIKYVRWDGTLWTVNSVEVRSPRLILSLGSVYNGPTP